MDTIDRRERGRAIADYTTLGQSTIGLDWATARRVAIEIVDDKIRNGEKL